MNILKVNGCIHFCVDFKLRTPLLLRSGDEGEFTDSAIERTADGRVHINGYVWASLLRRALSRLKETENLVSRIGRYQRNEKKQIDNLGVSTLWCGTTLGSPAGSDVRHGNRINRKWGAAVGKALFSDEVENPGGILTLEGNLFCEAQDNANAIIQQLRGALWVIHEGIENIGGGWSYGCGRLEVDKIGIEILNLTDPLQRARLWDFPGLANNQPAILDKAAHMIDAKRGWTKLHVEGRIEPGQLLAIHSSQPDYEKYKDWSHLPDTFVFRGMCLDKGEVKPKLMPLITGKSFRQAVLSTAIERQLMTKRYAECDKLRERWFGATDQGGIIAVLDAPIRNAAFEVLHRIQLCEHSFQNIQLFSGEYLTGGEFDLEILVDEGQENRETKELIGYVKDILTEIGPEAETKQKKEAPPGWYRLGATTTCTGQFSIKEWRAYHVG